MELLTAESESESESESEVLVRFRVSSTQLAVPAICVDEIVTLETPTVVPGVPRHVAGIVAVRGDAVPLLDLAELLGLGEAEQLEDRDPRVLVVRGGPYRVGLICDLVAGVAAVASARLASAETVQPPELRRFAEAQIDLGAGVAVLLDVARMLEAARA